MLIRDSQQAPLKEGHVYYMHEKNLSSLSLSLSLNIRGFVGSMRFTALVGLK